MKGFIKLEDLSKRSKRNPYLGYTEKINKFFTRKSLSQFVGAGSLLCAALLASSCQDDVDVNVAKNDTPKELQIEVINEGISDQETKGLITGTTFPANSEIGLTVTGPSTETYDGQTYKNLLYKYSGGTWSTTSKVYLTKTVGNVYAYYPYSASVTDITAVPIDASTDTDYMYAKTTANVSNTNPSATLGMAHAMTAVTVKVVKGNYTNTGTITGLTWKSSSAAKTAKMNAKTGGLTNITGANEVFDSGLTASNTTTLAAQTQYLFMAVPAGTSGPLSFTVNMDGQTYTAQSASVELKPGTKYNYTLEMNGVAMSVSSVTITDWVDKPVETIKPSL